MIIRVILFGGYLASINDMAAWQNSAKLQKPDVEFETHHWVSGASASDPVSHYQQTLAAAEHQINNTPEKTFYIVGHSSGCAVANELAKRVIKLKHWCLFALDGFRPTNDLNPDCWSAMCEGHKSLNYDALKSAVHFSVYQAKDATTKWALHFSLVNTNSTDKLVHDIVHGYANCEANLCWLRE